MNIADLLDRLRDPETGDPRSTYTLAWELHVAGLGELDAEGNVVEWRWVSSPKPADTAAIKYFDAIEKTEGYKATFDGLRGITAVGGTKVNLLFVDESTEPDNHVGELCRDEATWEARLGGTLYGDIDPPFDLPIAKGFAHFGAAGGLFHVGQEAFHYDGVDDEAETVHVVARGILGTMRQSHIVDASRQQSPVMRPEPVDWRDRPATLWKTVVESNGQRHAQRMEHAAGYLVGLAGDDATRCWHTITPWLGVAERQIGDSEAVAKLVPGWKVVDADDPGCRLQLWEAYGEGNGYQALNANYNPLADPADEMKQAQTAMHQDVFDKSAPAGSGRKGKIRVATGNDAQYFVRTYDLGDDIIEVDRDFEGLVAIPGGSNQTLVNVACEMSRTLDIREAPGGVAAGDASGAVAVPWPSALVVQVGRTLRPGSNIAADARAGHLPGFLDVRLNINAMGPHLRVQPTADLNPGPPELRIKLGDRDLLWYGLDLAAPEDPSHAIPTEQQFDRGRRGPADRTIEVDGPGQARAVRVDIRSVKAGHWQTGQRWILVDRGEWPLPPFRARVKSKLGEGETIQAVLIDDVRPASDLFAGVPGHLLQVHANVRWNHAPFGDELMGPGATTIQAVTTQPETALPVLMLQLLCSVNGRRNNIYDVYPAGCAVPLEAIDVDSFLDFPRQDDLTLARAEIQTGKSLRETLTPLLQYIGAHLVTRLDIETGRRRIRLERAGLPAPGPEADHIADGHWLADPPVQNVPDQRVVTGFEYTFNYDAEGEPQGRATITDPAAVSAQRGRDQLRKQALRGVELPGDAASHAAALIGPTLSRSAVYGKQRRVVRGRVPHNRAGHMEVGGEVFVSHATVRGKGGKRRLDLAPGRIIEITDSADDGVTSIAVEVLRGASKPYGPSLRLVGQVDAITAVVDRHRYALKRNKFTGAEQRALDLFRLQQRVWISKRGNSKVGVLRRIIAIDRDANRVTFDGAHGLTGPSWGCVDIPSYSLADPIDQERWAFFKRDVAYI